MLASALKQTKDSNCLPRSKDPEKVLYQHCYIIIVVLM